MLEPGGTHAQSRAAPPHRRPRDPPSIGRSLAQDLRDLGVTSVAALRRRNPERLPHGPHRAAGPAPGIAASCTASRCATYAARTARPRPELLPWWNWKGRTLAGR
ncbi:MAG: pathogenicity locus [Gemmatimonadetes bacterium]|nr:pathogenicity locus [Gemmatimonadota bacterium]